MASYKYRDNGKVQITITHGKRFDGNPKRFYKEVDYTTKKQLEVDAAIFLSDIIKGKVAAGTDSTISALYNDFITNHVSDASLKQTTTSRYELIYENQIKPFFANRKISVITRADIRQWVKHLLSEGNIRNRSPLKPKTVKNTLSLLSAMFNYAIYDLEIIDKNPCTRIKVANSTEKAIKERYTEAEFAELIGLLMEEKEVSRSKMQATLILLILFTGLRTGEVMGIKWEDIDFNNNTIDINKERVYISNLGVITDTPKTDSSIRTVSVPQFIMDMLTDLKAFQADIELKMSDEYTDSGYVAITANGSPQHPRNTYKWFRNWLQKNGLKGSTVHDLRHTHAAMLSSIGVKIIDVSKRLGHSNTRVTQEVYEYLFKNVDNEIANDLDNYYEKIQKCSQNVVKAKTNV